MTLRAPSPSAPRRVASIVGTTAAVLLCFSSIVSAQTADSTTSPSPTPGARVRVLTSNAPAPIAGRLEAIRADTLIIREDMSAAPRMLPAREVTRMEVLSRAPSVGRNTTIGGVLGMLAGGGGYLAWCSNNRDACRRDANSDPNPYDDESSPVLLGTMSILGGTLIGGGIGYVLTPRRWTEVQAPLQVGIAPSANGGIAVSGRLSFR